MKQNARKKGNRKSISSKLTVFLVTFLVLFFWPVASSFGQKSNSSTSKIKIEKEKKFVLDWLAQPELSKNSDVCLILFGPTLNLGFRNINLQNYWPILLNKLGLQLSGA